MDEFRHADMFFNLAKKYSVKYGQTESANSPISEYFEGERNFCLFENAVSIELNAEDCFCY